MADWSTDPTYHSPIRIPEWQDVIHIRPRAELTREDRRIWKRYLKTTAQKFTTVADLRAGISDAEKSLLEAQGITPDKLETLLRGRQIYQDIRRSQIPEWRRKIVQVLTKLDNVQDQISTILWITDPITRRWGPTRVASTIAHRVGDLISDIERAMAGPLMPGYRTIGRGAAAKRTPIGASHSVRATDRKHVATQTPQSSRQQTGKGGILQRAVKWLQKSQGHLLEAGQALDTWVGVGISLGTIFGALEEAQDRLIISAWEGAKFAVAGVGRSLTKPGSDLDQILREQQDASVQRVKETGAPLVAQMQGWITRGARAIPPFNALILTIEAAAHIMRDNDTYTSAEHALALYHTATITPLLAQTLSYIDDDAVVEMIPNLAPAAPRILNEYTRELLMDEGATITTSGHLIGEWQEPPTTLEQLIGQMIEESTLARATWLPERVATDQERLIHELVAANAPGTSMLLYGAEETLRVTPAPEQRAIILAMHHDALPPPGTPRATLRAWLDAQIAAINRDPTSYGWREWRDVTQKYWDVSFLT